MRLGYGTIKLISNMSSLNLSFNIPKMLSSKNYRIV